MVLQAAAAIRIVTRFSRASYIPRGSSGVGGAPQPVHVKFEVDERRFRREAINYDRTELHKARVRALARIAAMGRRNMQRLAPVGATARLRLGLAERILPQRLEARIISKARHTRPVLHGSRAHWPPAKPIERWVRRKLRVPAKRLKRVTFLVRRKIARRGTRKQDFVTAPFRHMVRTAPRIISQELKRAPGVR